MKLGGIRRKGFSGMKLQGGLGSGSDSDSSVEADIRELDSEEEAAMEEEEEEGGQDVPGELADDRMDIGGFLVLGPEGLELGQLVKKAAAGLAGPGGGLASADGSLDAEAQHFVDAIASAIREGRLAEGGRGRCVKDEIVRLHRLGAGASGAVYSALHVPSMQLVAMKEISVGGEAEQRQMEKELKMLYARIDHLPSRRGGERCGEERRAGAAAAVAAAKADTRPSQPSRRNGQESPAGGSVSDHVVSEPFSPGGSTVTGLAEAEEEDGGAGLQDWTPQSAEEMAATGPNVVRFFDAYSDPKDGKVVMVMEFMGGGSLKSVMDSGGCDTEAQAAHIAEQAIRGLGFLHAQHQLHRDIKPANILKSADGRVIKLADFGVSKQLSDTYDQANTFVGTRIWMAPERIGANGSGYAYPSDVWSMGMSILSVAAGRFPYSDLGYWNLSQITEKDVPIRETMQAAGKPLSRRFEDWLRRALDRDPARRANCAELLRHPFIQQHTAPGVPRQVVPLRNDPAKRATDLYVNVRYVLSTSTNFRLFAKYHRRDPEGTKPVQNDKWAWSLQTGTFNEAVTATRLIKATAGGDASSLADLGSTAALLNVLSSEQRSVLGMDSLGSSGLRSAAAPAELVMDGSASPDDQQLLSASMVARRRRTSGAVRDLPLLDTLPEQNRRVDVLIEDAADFWHHADDKRQLEARQTRPIQPAPGHHRRHASAAYQLPVPRNATHRASASAASRPAGAEAASGAKRHTLSGRAAARFIMHALYWNALGKPKTSETLGSARGATSLGGTAGAGGGGSARGGSMPAVSQALATRLRQARSPVQARPAPAAGSGSSGPGELDLAQNGGAAIGRGDLGGGTTRRVSIQRPAAAAESPQAAAAAGSGDSHGSSLTRQSVVALEQNMKRPWPPTLPELELRLEDVRDIAWQAGAPPTVVLAQVNQAIQRSLGELTGPAKVPSRTRLGVSQAMAAAAASTGGAVAGLAASLPPSRYDSPVATSGARATGKAAGGGGGGGGGGQPEEGEEEREDAKVPRRRRLPQPGPKAARRQRPLPQGPGLARMRTTSPRGARSEERELPQLALRHSLSPHGTASSLGHGGHERAGMILTETGHVVLANPKRKPGIHGSRRG